MCYSISHFFFFSDAREIRFHYTVTDPLGVTGALADAAVWKGSGYAEIANFHIAVLIDEDI